MGWNYFYKIYSDIHYLFYADIYSDFAFVILSPSLMHNCGSGLCRNFQNFLNIGHFQDLKKKKKYCLGFINLNSYFIEMLESAYLSGGTHWFSG